jgi:hypothetical protein
MSLDDSTACQPDAPTAANLKAFRRAAALLLVFGCVALLIALGLIAMGAWCCTHETGGGGEWKGLNKVIGFAFIGAGAVLLIPSVFMLAMQGFVRAGSRTAAGVCIVTECVFALLPAVFILLRAVIANPGSYEFALGFLALTLWVGLHGWLVATLRKARARDIQMAPA